MPAPAGSGGAHARVLEVPSVFAHRLIVLPDTGAPIAITVSGVPARIELPGVRWTPVDWTGDAEQWTAAVEVVRGASVRGAAACVTVEAPRRIETPDFVLAAGARLQRLMHDRETGDCLGCYVIPAEGSAGEAPPCDGADTEVCGLRLPCAALEASAGPPPQPDVEVDSPGPDGRLGVFRSERFPSDGGRGAVAARGTTTGDPYVITRPGRLRVVRAAAGAPATIIVAPGLRLQASVEADAIEWRDKFGFGATCCDHAPVVCGGAAGRNRDRLRWAAASLPDGAPLLDEDGRPWASSAGPIAVRYLPAGPPGLVRLESDALRGICEAGESCACGSRLFHARAADLAPADGPRGANAGGPEAPCDPS